MLMYLWCARRVKSRSETTLISSKRADFLREIHHLLRRRGLVVSPPALEEPLDEAVRAGGEPGHLRQLDLDGAGVAREQGLAAAPEAQAEELREAGAHDARGHHGR